MKCIRPVETMESEVTDSTSGANELLMSCSNSVPFNRQIIESKRPRRVVAANYAAGSAQPGDQSRTKYCNPSKLSSRSTASKRHSAPEPVRISFSHKTDKLECNFVSVSSTKRALVVDSAFTDDIDSELLAVGDVNDELADQVDELTRRCRNAELVGNECTCCASMVHELACRDQLIAVLRNQKQYLLAELSERNCEVMVCRAEADRLSTALAEKDCLLTKLNSELERATTSRKETELLVGQQRAEIQRLDADLQMANTSVSVCASEFERACAASDALRKELNENANVLAFYRNALAQRDAELDAVRSHQHSLLDRMTNDSTRSDQLISNLHRRIALLEGGLDSCDMPEQAMKDHACKRERDFLEVTDLSAIESDSSNGWSPNVVEPTNETLGQSIIRLEFTNTPNSSVFLVAHDDDW